MEIKSTAQATSALKMLAFISAYSKTTQQSAIKGKFFKLKDSVKNDYKSDDLPIIPKGTVIQADFGGDFGLYALADIKGVLHKVKIDLIDLHKIDFGVIPDDVVEQADEALAYVRGEIAKRPDRDYY